MTPHSATVRSSRSDAGVLTPGDVDPFLSVSEFLAQHWRAPTGSARELQEVLEKRVTDPGFGPAPQEPEPEGRWAPWQTTLLVLAVAAVFWGGLIWLFLKLFG